MVRGKGEDLTRSYWLAYAILHSNLVPMFPRGAAVHGKIRYQFSLLGVSLGWGGGNWGKPGAGVLVPSRHISYETATVFWNSQAEESQSMFFFWCVFTMVSRKTDRNFRVVTVTGAERGGGVGRWQSVPENFPWHS